MTNNKKDEGTLATHAYTYEVLMVVQILAEDEKEARNRLDGKGVGRTHERRFWNCDNQIRLDMQYKNHTITAGSFLL